MDYMLQKHGAKHVYRIPEGLPELCSDISREVLRCQPENIYHFIADYVDALLVTRENAKVAVKVVDNIIAGSETIVNTLQKCGVKLDDVATAVTKLQNCFREFLDEGDQLDFHQVNSREDEISIGEIIEATGTPLDNANRAAIKIQSTFRGHRERMDLGEKKGEIQWQRAAVNTIEILRKSEVSKTKISEATTTIPSVYRSYYSSKNSRRKLHEEKDWKKVEKNEFTMSKERIQTVTGWSMIYKFGVKPEHANRAASTIQNAFRKYRLRKEFNPHHSAPTNTEVGRGIRDNLHQKSFEKVSSNQVIPAELLTMEEIAKASEKLGNSHKERLNAPQMSLKSKYIILSR